MHEFVVRPPDSVTPANKPSRRSRVPLVVGPADDPHERDADAIADQVVAALRRPMGDVAPPTSRIARRTTDAGALTVGAPAASRIQRAYRPATVTKAKGASLHKSDRKSTKATQRGAAKVRSGGVFGTGLKVRVPYQTQLQVDTDVESVDGHYVLATYKANVQLVAPTTGATIGPTTVLTTDESTSESEPPDIDEIFDNAADLAEGIDQALDQLHPLSIDLLQPFIMRAPRSERDLAWQDQALMKKAKRLMTLDDYLALLPALGMLVPPTTGVLPRAQGKYTTHMSATEVDILIGKHLGGYVAEAKLAGRKAEGEISVVDDADWELAFERQWPGQKPSMASAFVDVDQPKRQIWLHKDRGDPGTAIHEGMHKYANNEIRNRQRDLYRKGMVQIGRLDEGLTEYFTRLITPTLGLTRSSYPDEFDLASRLVAIVTEAVAARAYFDGEFDTFINTYLSKTGRSREHWDLLSQEFEQDRFDDAQDVLDTGAE
jgi:hypothetical protein